MQNENLLTGELQIDSIAYSHLKETAGWAKFLAIVGFVVSGLILLAALFAGSLFSSVSAMPSSVAGLMIVIYVIGAVIAFIVSLYMYKFATKMKVALMNNDQEEMNMSFANLKLVFRIYGIIMIIYLAIIVLAMIGGMLTAMMR